MIAIVISSIAFLFSISGFILGLMGYIQARATSQSTHTVHGQPQAMQEDISHLFGAPEEDGQPVTEVPTGKIEEMLLKGFE